ncbi:MAG: acetone carboxylase subunit gamma, partial [Solirubrobacterales bacterium]
RPEYAEKAYSVSDRDGARRRRLERARPVEQWRAEQRERILAGDLIEPVKVGYAESMKLSARWAAEFRGFWDLPEGFAFDVPTPTLPLDLRPEDGRITPAESASRFLAGSSVASVEPPAAAGRPLEPETLEALYDERLSRGEVKDIQSGYKDPDRFEKWIAVLQSRVPWDDPIVLPLGEGLYVVRRTTNPAAPGGEAEEAAGLDSLAIRSDAGHDFCRFDQNWKMHAPVFVRDTDELLREIYPAMAHCDPEWMELREFYCPLSGRMLETEAVTPGYPVVHDFLPDVEGFYRGWLGREVP